MTAPGRMNIVIPKTLHQKLKDQAAKEGRMLQWLVERLLNDGLKGRKAA